jgi:hypothetical protein
VSEAYARGDDRAERLESVVTTIAAAMTLVTLGAAGCGSEFDAAEGPCRLADLGLTPAPDAPPSSTPMLENGDTIAVQGIREPKTVTTYGLDLDLAGAPFECDLGHPEALRQTYAGLTALREQVVAVGN